MKQKKQDKQAAGKGSFHCQENEINCNNKTSIADSNFASTLSATLSPRRFGSLLKKRWKNTHHQSTTDCSKAFVNKATKNHDNDESFRLKTRNVCTDNDLELSALSRFEKCKRPESIVKVADSIDGKVAVKADVCNDNKCTGKRDCNIGYDNSKLMECDQTSCNINFNDDPQETQEVISCSSAGSNNKSHLIDEHVNVMNSSTKLNQTIKLPNNHNVVNTKKPIIIDIPRESIDTPDTNNNKTHDVHLEVTTETRKGNDFALPLDEIKTVSKNRSNSISSNSISTIKHKARDVQNIPRHGVHHRDHQSKSVSYTNNQRPRSSACSISGLSMLSGGQSPLCHQSAQVSLSTNKQSIGFRNNVVGQSARTNNVNLHNETSALNLTNLLNTKIGVILLEGSYCERLRDATAIGLVTPPLNMQDTANILTSTCKQQQYQPASSSSTNNNKQQDSPIPIISSSNTSKLLDWQHLESTGPINENHKLNEEMANESPFAHQQQDYESVSA